MKKTSFVWIVLDCEGHMSERLCGIFSTEAKAISYAAYCQEAATGHSQGFAVVRRDLDEETHVCKRMRDKDGLWKCVREGHPGQ